MDLHAGQIQGFFNIPVDNLFARPVILDYIKKNFDDQAIIVSPDAGGVERARSYAKKLGTLIAIIDKRREAPSEAEAMHVIGDVKKRKAIIVDDMVDTAGTLNEAAQALKENGALEVHACCVHPVLSGPAIDRINKSEFKTLVVTNTIPLSERAKKCKKIQVVSIAKLLAEAIQRSHTDQSGSSLFI